MLANGLRVMDVVNVPHQQVREGRKSGVHQLPQLRGHDFVCFFVQPFLGQVSVEKVRKC